MAEDKVPRFLQQTTSQLLHQQAALRKRREMLERESAKPPAMRFGTGSPPRSHSRHTKSPVPMAASSSSVSSVSDRPATHRTPPRGDNVQRELNWSKADEDALGERAPMRFSMTFRPAPTPVASGRPRAGTQLPYPVSPTPREVNTADRVSPGRRKAARDPSTPLTISPRSPPSQRARPDDASVAAENNADVPVQILDPKAKGKNPSEAKSTNAMERSAIVGATEGDDNEEEGEVQEMTRAEKRRSLPPPPPFPPKGMNATAASLEPETRHTDGDATGIAGFSNNFAVPRFTPTTPRTTETEERAHTFTQEKGEEAEGDATPGRPAVGEFRTPRPVTRMSTSLTPLVYGDSVSHTNSSVVEEGADQKQRAEGQPDEKEVKASGTSPTTTPSQLLASFEASAEKRGGAAPTPAMSRDHNQEEAERSAAVEGVAQGRSPSHTFRASPSASRSVETQTPSPSRRTKASPAPTAQDLIQSVQASADRRPCGCERPTPSPESWTRHRDASSRPTASPQPMPVAMGDMPMTAFDSPTHKCCDRPTPASLSSQPAGGEARGTAAPSSSPWPTTENIISSILAGTQEGQRRARGAASNGLRDTGNGDDGAENWQRLSHDEEEEQTDEVGREEEESRFSPTTAATHTPSPVPTDRQYGQSVLTSAERRRCGRPTPGEREVSPAHYDRHERHTSADVMDTSASPQPSAHHLLDSLDVSIEKANTREKRAERMDAPEDEEEQQQRQRSHSESNNNRSAYDYDGHEKAMRTPSPTPTPEHVVSSLQASAEKRKRSAAVDMSPASSDPKPTRSTTNGSCDSNSFHSPTLTAQNVKDSIQKLVTDAQQTRSDAQAPHHPWGESRPRTSETNWNSSASPVVTAEDVDMSLGALEQDRRRQSRSTRADRDWREGSPASVASKAAENEAGVERKEAEAPVAQLPAVPAGASASSPAGVDFVFQSAMFFDCVSAPLTPTPPDVETILMSETTTRVISTAADERVPPKFIELQREITAISAGRSRSHTQTPPRLHASEASSPVPTPQSTEVADAPRAETATELPPSPMAESDTAEAEATQRRSSLVLVHATRGHAATIQHPHEPVPVVPPPTISSVQVPRTPTPPPRHAQLPLGRRESVPFNYGVEAQGESPLPRPVSLRSQVSLSKPSLPLHAGHLSRSPVPARPTRMASEQTTRPFAGDPTAMDGGSRSERQTAVLAPRRRSASLNDVDGADRSNDDEDLFDSKNDWMDLVEPLRPHTLTVSPHGGSVVYTTHSPHGPGEQVEHNTEVPSPAQSVPQHLASPSPTARKRSRSACTPPAGQRSDNAVSAVTPASVALTMDDGTSTSGKSSQLLTHTPSSYVSPTPRSSTRGRQSQAEELLAMLPADVAAEFRRIEKGEDAEETAQVDEEDADEDDLSTTAQMSTANERDTKRPERVHRGDDYYATYLDELARSSARKVRAGAGRRMQKTFRRASEAEAAGRKNESSAGELPVSAPAPSADSLPRRSHSTSSAPSTEISTRGMMSPMPPPSPAGEGEAASRLEVSTRLSAELQQALFRDSPATRKGKKAAKKSAVASTKRGSSAKKTAQPSVEVASPPHTEAATKEKVVKAAHRPRGRKVVRKFQTAKALRAMGRTTKSKKGH